MVRGHHSKGFITPPLHPHHQFVCIIFGHCGSERNLHFPSVHVVAGQWADDRDSFTAVVVISPF